MSDIDPLRDRRLGLGNGERAGKSGVFDPGAGGEAFEVGMVGEAPRCDLPGFKDGSPREGDGKEVVFDNECGSDMLPRLRKEVEGPAKDTEPGPKSLGLMVLMIRACYRVQTSLMCFGM